MLAINKFCFKFLAFLAVLIFSLNPFKLSAQNINNYAFTNSTQAYASIGGTVATIAGSYDEGYVNGISIGFDFWYMGTKYNSVSVSTNGWLVLGQSITDALPNNILSGSGTKPIIAPLWDNLRVYPGILNFLLPGTISYVTSGTEPSRTFTVQWGGVEWNSGSSDLIYFQAILSEVTGKIQFNYSYSPLVGPTTPSASVGIAGSNSFLSVNKLDGTTGFSVSSSAETTGISAAPASGLQLSFTPAKAAAPTGLTFSNVGPNQQMLKWNDIATDNSGYVIYRSTNATSGFVQIGSVLSGTTTSYLDAGLTAATTYYYKIYAIREGLSNALAGSNTTLANCTSLSLLQISNANIIANYRLNGVLTIFTALITAPCKLRQHRLPIDLM